MTSQQKAVMIGWYRQGAPIEQIMVLMNLPYSVIKLGINISIPKQFIDHVEKERNKAKPKRYKSKMGTSKGVFPTGTFKKSNFKNTASAL